MKKQLSIGLVSALIAISSQQVAALESQVKWNSAGVNYTSVSIDNISNIEPSGFGLSANHLLNDKIFVYGEYYSTSDDMKEASASMDLDLSSVEFGAGYKYSINEQFELFGSVGYLSQTADVKISAVGWGTNTDSTDADGFAFKVGAVAALNDKFQVMAGYHQYSVEVDGDDTDDSGLILGATYLVTKNLALSAGYESGDDASSTSFGISYFY